MVIAIRAGECRRSATQIPRSAIPGISIPGFKLTSHPRLKPDNAWRRTYACKTGVLHGTQVLLIIGAVDRGAIDLGEFDLGAE